MSAIRNSGEQGDIRVGHLAVADGRLVIVGPSDQVPMLSRPGRPCLLSACERNAGKHCIDDRGRPCPDALEDQP